MMIDVDKLVEWVGSEGAKQALQKGKLSMEQLVSLAKSRNLPISSKPTREEIANELAYFGIKKIDKTGDQLVSLEREELRKYLTGRKPTRAELIAILDRLGVKPSSEDKKSLLKFAVQEISDIGLYQRVAGSSRQKKPIK